MNEPDEADQIARRWMLSTLSDGSESDRKTLAERIRAYGQRQAEAAARALLEELEAAERRVIEARQLRHESQIESRDLAMKLAAAEARVKEAEEWVAAWAEKAKTAQERVEQLEAALKPFAEYAQAVQKVHGDETPDEWRVTHNGIEKMGREPTVGDCRRADAALKE